MRRTNRRTVVAGGALAFAGLSLTRSPALAADRPVGIWTNLTPMPFAVQEIYPTAYIRAVMDGQTGEVSSHTVLVNAGGLTDAALGRPNVTDKVTIFDPIAGAWRLGKPLPEARHHLALVFHKGYVFAVNGFARDAGGGWQMRSSLWRIDNPETGAWKTLTPPPTPQAEAVTASLGNRIHLVGGRAPASSRNREWNDHLDTDRHWAYDPVADRWEPRRAMPNRRNSAAGAVYGGVLYVIGGRTVGGGNSPLCNVYDPVADRWQDVAPLPAPVQQTAPTGQGGLAAAEWNGYIYAFGGEWFGGTSGVYADVWEYDPREDKWRAVAAMPRPRHGLGAVALKDGIYVCGGATRPGGAGVSKILDRFEI